MLKISNNGFITISRGEEFTLPLFINNGTKMRPARYYIQEHPKDTIYLGVMEATQPFKNALIKKCYNADSAVNEYGDLVVSFSKDDTLYLVPGKYYYEIIRQDSKGCFEVISPATEFVIEEKRC